MKARTLVFFVILFLVLLIAAINWTEFTTPVTLSLLVTSINIPIGLFMLGVICVLSVLYLFFVWKTQTSAFFESRRKNSEVEKARKLASNEEESRIGTLRKLVEDEMVDVHGKLDMILKQLAMEGDAGTTAEEKQEEDVVDKIGDSLKNIGKKIKESI
ncbi:MAG: LapA family protein [Rhodothermales bacterium]